MTESAILISLVGLIRSRGNPKIPQYSNHRVELVVSGHILYCVIVVVIVVQQIVVIVVLVEFLTKP